MFLDQAKDYDIQNNKKIDFKGRTITSLDISGSQYITQNDVWKFGYTFIHMNGMLNNISNNVKVDSNPYTNTLSRVEEKLPSQRVRHAPNTQWVHAYSAETALDFHYRYYFDNWDLKAHTTGIGLRQSYLDDNVFLYLTYRFYNQDSTKYYKKSFSTSEKYTTSDSDLDTYDGHRVGAHYFHILGDSKLWNMDFIDWDFSSAIYAYNRSNNLDYYILQFSIGTSF